MESTYPENPTSDLSKAIDALLKGRDVATRLKTTFDTHTHVTDDQSSMVNQILNSFTSSLSLLSGVSDNPEVSQFLANTHCWDACHKSEDSGESSKSTATLKERRGCYKRRLVQSIRKNIFCLLLASVWQLGNKKKENNLFITEWTI